MTVNLIVGRRGRLFNAADTLCARQIVRRRREKNVKKKSTAETGPSTFADADGRRDRKCRSDDADVIVHLVARRALAVTANAVWQLERVPHNCNLWQYCLSTWRIVEIVLKVYSAVNRIVII